MLEAAAVVDPGIVRSLDAIQLVAAQLFGDRLSAVVTCDRGMTAAAAQLDLSVDAPR